MPRPESREGLCQQAFPYSLKDGDLTECERPAGHSSIHTNWKDATWIGTLTDEEVAMANELRRISPKNV